jgi:hypothetical protein
LTCNLQKGVRSEEFPDQGAAEKKSRPVQKGVWGGPHIIVEVTDNGAKIEHDCADGTIEDRGNDRIAERQPV